MPDSRCIALVLFLSGVQAHAQADETSMPTEDAPTDIVVVLDHEVSQAVRGRGAVPQAQTSADEISDKLQRLGFSLRPQHPATTDRELSGYFNLTVPAGQDAGSLVETLLQLEGVEGAYIKPRPAPP